MWKLLEGVSAVFQLMVLHWLAIAIYAFLAVCAYLLPIGKIFLEAVSGHSFLFAMSVLAALALLIASVKIFFRICLDVECLSASGIPIGSAFNICIVLFNASLFYLALVMGQFMIHACIFFA